MKLERPSPRRRLGAVAVVAAVAMVLSACGARVSPYFPVSSGAGGASKDAGGASNPNSGITGGNTPATTTAVSGGGATGGGGGASTGPAQGQGPAQSQGQTGSGQQPASGQATGPVAPAALTPQNFSYNPQQQAAYCTGTTGNSSSAPGVTPTSITVGNVSGLTGEVSATFGAGSQAATALFNAINHYGGICGRQLKLSVQDDQQSSANNASDVASLIPNVLAFVGSVSDADNGGVNEMVQAGVPDMGPAINVNRSNSGVYWSATGGSVTVKNGRALINDAWIQGLKANHQMPKKIAVLSYSIPISAQAGQEFATAFQKDGSSLCYSDYNVPPAGFGSVLSSDVTKMNQNGCDGMFSTMDIVANGTLLKDMAQQGYHPPLVSATYESYNPAQISFAGESAAQGLDISLASVPLNDPVAGVQLYTQLMQTFEPGQPLSEFGLAAWADAELFVYALIKAGRNPTRQSLIAALQGVSNWTSDGAYGAYTPSARTGPPCTTNVVVRGNDFARTWPSSGLFCQGQLVDVGPAS